MSKRYPSFSYNFEKYSARDIVEFVDSLGIETKFYLKGPLLNQKGFLIEKTNILIRFPSYESIRIYGFETLRKTGDVIWFNSKDRYGMASKQDMEIINKISKIPKEELNTPADFEEHKKLFSKLKRKFQMKKDEQPRAIKDLEWIKSLEKGNSGNHKKFSTYWLLRGINSCQPDTSATFDLKSVSVNDFCYFTFWHALYC